VGERNDTLDDFWLCIQWPTTLSLIHAPKINFWSTIFLGYYNFSVDSWSGEFSKELVQKVLWFPSRTFALPPRLQGRVYVEVRVFNWISNIFLIKFMYIYIYYTTGIRAFAECRPLCRVPFVGHLAKEALPRAALGEVLLSVTSWFTECRTLGTGNSRQRHVCRMSKIRQRWCSAKGRQRSS
jgi:hypothetical protein